MKVALITGSSGFIGTNLIRRLKSEGYFVIGADIEMPKYEQPDRFYHYDLRVQNLCSLIFTPNKFTEGYDHIDEVYNLACLMGGMGYIGNPQYSYDVMIGSTQIVTNILDCCVNSNVSKVFYSSSACVYNQQLQEKNYNIGLKESDAYPAWPDLIYGWQKLCSEKMHESAMLSHGLNIRIARFHNIYGPEGCYDNGKEKAPAAMCRKAIQSDKSFSVWGDGNQTRSFLYIDDCIDAVRLLMESDFKEPINIGSEEAISIRGLAQMAIDISGKNLYIDYEPQSKTIGVNGRNSCNDLIRQVLNWDPKYTLRQGMELTYKWISQQYGL
jgi:nucleoside-diphosphate-sugar epimerase